MEGIIFIGVFFGIMGILAIVAGYYLEKERKKEKENH
ncbi:MAG: hypothetical protein PWQ25_1746 [Deferribacteres bacterium]|jgi:hypothetical protein|nr:hypothetical protein [Deferribacteres bacterium]